MGALFSKLWELFNGKQLEILMVGLANSGKTTLLNVISDNEPGDTLPTVGVNVRHVKKGNVTMKGECIWVKICDSNDRHHY